MTTSPWNHVERIAEAAREDARSHLGAAIALIEAWNRHLSPLSDPLDTDFGTHQWLRSSREEAYSDWLAWIIVRIGNLGAIAFLLDVPPGELLASDGPIRAEREPWVKTGHPEKSGRLDILVCAGHRALVVVEVKTGNADEADTAKGEGYSKSYPHLPRRLIATAGNQASYPGNFVLVTWGSIAQRLRQLSRRWLEKDLITAAMVLGFVGAVEQNLLGFPSRIRDSTCWGAHLLSLPSLWSHLRSGLAKGDSHMADMTAEADHLFTDGMAGYLEARLAMKTFEKHVQDIARDVLLRRLPELATAMGRIDLATNQMNSYDKSSGPSEPPYAWLGQKVVLSGGGTLWIGVIWQPASGDAPATYQAAVSISAPRKEASHLIVTSLKDTVSMGVRLDTPFGNEVQLSTNLEHPYPADLHGRLETLMSEWVEFWRRTGGTAQVRWA